MTCVNNVAPLQLPITSVSTTTTGSGTTRGIAVSIGDPYQLFSMKPSTTDNNTWVYNVNSCANSPDYKCIARLGGLYDYKASHTSQVINSLSSWNGTPDSEFQNVPSYILDNDIFLAGGNGDIYGFPFFSWTQEPSLANLSNQAVFGFGTNSTFLRAAAEAGTVPSKQYSIWPGVASILYPTDGLLIVGGYDEARKNGQFTNFTSRPDVPLYVEITDITWQNTAGDITSILPNDTTRLLGTLEPFYDAIYLPPLVYDNFQSASNATYNATLGKLVYDSSLRPTGTMTITLSNGYKTKISGSDLFDYPQDYDETGNMYITNSHLVTAKVEAYSPYPQYWLYIGVPFMTMNYVVVDYENNMFMMAPAARDDFGQKTALHLKSLCTPTSPPKPTTPTPTPTPTPSSHHNSTAAIAGGVGGGVGGLLLVGAIFALIFLWRRRKRRAAAQRHQSRSSQQQGDKAAYSETTESTELPSATQKHVASWISANRDEGFGRGPGSYGMDATSGPFEMPTYRP